MTAPTEAWQDIETALRGVAGDDFVCVDFTFMRYSTGRSGFIVRLFPTNDSLRTGHGETLAEALENARKATLFVSEQEKAA